MDLELITFLLLGIIVGIIYLLDGWRSSPSRDNAKLSESPKIRGLLYVLGGLFLSSIVVAADYITDKTKDIRAIYIYVIALIITVLTGLFLIALYTFIHAYIRHRALEPGHLRREDFVKALEYTTIALQDGLPAFREAINTYVNSYIAATSTNNAANLESQHETQIGTLEKDYQQKIEALIQEKEKAEQLVEETLDFYFEIFRWIAEKSTVSDDPVRGFKNLLRGSLRLYLTLFFEQKSSGTRRKGASWNYRACLYYLDGSELRYIEGDGPRSAQHSHQPLPLNSAAGWALRNPNQAHKYPGDVPEESFFPREGTSVYAGVICCATTPNTAQKSNPFLVFNVDFIEDEVDEKKAAYLKSRAVELTRVITDAAIILGVTPQLLHQSQKKSPNRKKKPPGS